MWQANSASRLGGLKAWSVWKLTNQISKYDGQDAAYEKTSHAKKLTES